ncbi:IS256 family transposase [Mycobacteroides abscessus]|uniref:Mutator family transposase n=12 Tax=Mycobacteriaceae TaxID=1762 RepID=A0AAE4VK90_MYCFO|nr:MULTISPECIES: IS256 family transposase [Mycobacteriaceae]ANO21883.1 transposase [Mycobacteroides abscessus]KLI03984.1 transposase [Mycolicibacterium senegalense]KLO54623.1 transposase [Mycolicibacterium senegalense]KMV13507.1 transposase [Mycolicibacterium conceptionense]KWX20737.1 transposase [Mycolicibacterium wolinskyi]
MSETLESMAIDVDQRQLAEQLLAQAKERGIELVGPNGLLNQLTKNVLETALDAEMAEHLGYDKHDPAGRGSGNSRNGSRSKTVFTEIGPVEIEVPRDTNSTFDPVIVKKRQRRLTGVDEIVLSLTAKGLTTGEIAAHFDDVYGATVSKDTISKITDKVIEEMTEWCNRPLESVYPVVFIDAIFVKVRDGQVSNRPVYVAIGVTCAGERDILGLWAGDGGEGAKFWLSVLTEIKNRGTGDVCIVVCDGLKGLPDAINTVWPRAVVQTCVIHLLRNTFRYASRKYWDQIAKDIRPVYTAATEAAAKERFSEFTAKWGAQYPAITQLWQNAWSEFVPFLDYDIEIRRVICSTNAVESLNARYRRAIRARGHFPTEQAAMKCLYLVTRSLDPTGRGKARWAMRWKPALNAFAITFNGRITPTGN